jgi:hypothetical protein
MADQAKKYWDADQTFLNDLSRRVFFKRLKKLETLSNPTEWIVERFSKPKHSLLHLKL